MFRHGQGIPKILKVLHQVRTISPRILVLICWGHSDNKFEFRGNYLEYNFYPQVDNNSPNSSECSDFSTNSSCETQTVNCKPTDAKYLDKRRRNNAAVRKFRHLTKNRIASLERKNDTLTRQRASYLPALKGLITKAKGVTYILECGTKMAKELVRDAENLVTMIDQELN